MNSTTLNDFEIMAPVGSRESLAAAIQAGADSIYFGIENLNMRARSANTFTIDDLREIAQTCDEHGMKSYLTVNTIIYDNDISLMRTIVDAAKAAGISAVIAADVAVMSYARQIGQEVHLSTQLNISNVEALRFYAQFADVVVLARELNLEQVAEIYRHICEENICGPSGERIRIEMFCHGALCMAVSGKCYLSLHEMNHSANRGACMHMGDAIPLNQVQRLQQRCNKINALYQKDRKNYSYCRAIFIHVDSRSKGKQTDVFFYHSNKKAVSKRLANNMKDTFESKYGKHQPNRGFSGTVSGRNLYVLSHTTPASVFVELGNIQNSFDQRRLVINSNRQALAKWLMEGFLKDYKEKK